MPIRVQTRQVGLERSIQKAVQSVNRRGGLNININDRQFTRPLGKITGSVSEFNKSLEASNARVLAFGASVGIIQGVQRAFAGLITTTVKVEKALAQVNVVMGVSNDELEKFSRGLFRIARNTAQSFDTVATAATELARQGLGVNETLKRTQDALILTRLTGMDAASAVSGLTAALNTFNKAGLDSTKVLSKMAAVDVQFAVSTEDLVDGIARAGAVAQDAGVSFDQLLGAVTAAQQQTARGGKVIGNSFKTIFTRVQRGSTIKRLEELGIAVRDVSGSTLPAINVLKNLADTYETLGDVTKAAVAEQVGGVFQINILKAAIKDLANENSVLARATKISAMATDEAYKKNELLNKTIAALTAQTASSIQEFARLVGEIGLDEPIRAFLEITKNFFTGANNLLSSGEGIGSELAKGIVKGIGNVISGPGMLAFIAVFGALFRKTIGFLAGSMKELLGVTTIAQKQKAIQQSIVAVLSENSALQQKILSQEGNRAAQEKTILSILQAQAREQQRIAAAAAAIAPAVSRSGFGPTLRKGKSSGHIPNYVSSSERSMERAGAKSGGYSPGVVKSTRIPGEGRVVYNSAEKLVNFSGMSQPAIMPPRRSKAGRNYKKAFGKVHGFNPYASEGFVPNFSRQRSVIDAKVWGERNEALNKVRSVEFTSNVGDQRFTTARAVEIPDPLKPLGQKMGLQVINVDSSNKALRGKGYGKELYTFMAQYAKKNGYSGLYGDMGTSPSAMRVVDSLAKSGKFNISKNKDLHLVKDDWLPGGSSWASDSWTYRIANNGLIPNFARGRTYRGESPANIARALVFGGKTAMNLSVGKGKTLQDVWHSYGPAMATGTQMNSIREKVYKSFIQGRPISFIDEVNNSLRGYGRNVPKEWGDVKGGGDLVYGMVQSLNSSRKSSRMLDMPYSKGFVPNFININPLHGNFSKIKGGMFPSFNKGRHGAFGTEAKSKMIFSKNKQINDLAHMILKGDLTLRQATMAVHASAEAMFKNPKNKKAGADLIAGYSSLMSNKKFAKFLKPDMLKSGGFVPNFVKGSRGLPSQRNAEDRAMDAWLDEVNASYRNPGPKKYFTPKAQSPRQSVGKRFRDLDPMMMQKAAIMYWKGGYMRPGKPIPPHLFPHTLIPSIMRDSLRVKRPEDWNMKVSGGFVPNFGKGAPSMMFHATMNENLANIKKHGLLSSPGALRGQDYKDKLQYHKMLKGMDEMGLLNPMQKGELQFLNKQFGGLLYGWGSEAAAHKFAFQKNWEVASARGLNPNEAKLTSVISFMSKAKGAKWSPDDLDPTYVNAWKTQGNIPSSNITGVSPASLDIVRKFGANGLIPNFARGTGLKLNASNITPVAGPLSKRGKIFQKNPKFDRDIGRKELDDILTNQLFKSIHYVDKKGNDIIYTQARHGVHEYKKGAPAPKGYKKWADLDKSTKSRVVWAGSAGSGKDAYRRLKLKRIKSVVTGGEHLRFNRKLANSGLIPNYALLNTPFGKDYYSGLDSLKPTHFRDATVLKYESFQDKTKLNTLLNSASGNLEALKYLDNKGLEAVKSALIKEGRLGSADFEYVKSGIGQASTADIEKELRTIPARHLFNYLTGATDRIPSSQTGNFIRLLDHKERALAAVDMVGKGELSSKAIKDQFNLIKKSKNRRASVFKEFLYGDRMSEKRPLGLPYNPNRAIDPSPGIVDRSGRQVGLLAAIQAQQGQLNQGASVLTGRAHLGANRSALRKMGAKLREKQIWQGFNTGNMSQSELVKQLQKEGLVSGSSRAEAHQRKMMGKQSKINKQIKWQTMFPGIRPNPRMLAFLIANLKKSQNIKGLPSLKDLLTGGGSAGATSPFRAEPPSMRDLFGMASGFIPNFSLFTPNAKGVLDANPAYANAVLNSVKRESSFGLTPKVVSAPQLKSSKNPGLAVVNMEQEGGSLAKAKQLHGGLNPMQGASTGHVPNYAPVPGSISPAKFFAAKIGAKADVAARGLNSISKAAGKTAATFDTSSAAFKALKKEEQAEIKKAAKAQASLANATREAEIRQRSLNKAVKSKDAGFAREMFRRDAAASMAQKSGMGGVMAGLMNKSGQFSEKKLAKAIRNADDAGDKRTLRSLMNVDKSLDKMANRAMDRPAALSKDLNKMFSGTYGAEKTSDRIMGTKGFKKIDAQKHFAKDFLASRGMDVRDMKSSSAVTAIMGSQKASKAFRNFMQEQGVRSSSGVLARGGLMTGEMKKLTKGNKAAGDAFKKALKGFEKTIQKGGILSPLHIASQRAQLNQLAAAAGKNPQAMAKLQETVKNVEKQAREKPRTGGFGKWLLKQGQALQQGGGVSGRFIGGMATGAAGGSSDLTRAGRAGARAGVFARSLGSQTAKFASSVKGMGGNMGMAAAFMLPMMAGMMESKIPRHERASFDASSGQFKVQSGGDFMGMHSDRVGSTLMGAGMGAMFGLPGMIAGTAIGFAMSAKKMTLTIDEMVQAKEKEISSLNQSIQAGGKLSSLTRQRAGALANNDTRLVGQIDSQMAQVFASINDPEALRRFSRASGSEKSLNDVTNELSADLAREVSTQNFQTAQRNTGGGGGGTALASILKQSVDSGKITSKELNSTLIKISERIEQADMNNIRSGNWMTQAQVNEMRQKAAGGGMLNAETIGSGLVGAGIGAGIVGLLGLLSAPFTGGTSMLIAAAAMGSLAAAGSMSEQQQEAQDAMKARSAQGGESINFLDDLRKAGAISQQEFENMTAAFYQGRKSARQIVNEMTDSLEQMNEISRNTRLMEGKLFDLNVKLRTTITNLNNSIRETDLLSKSDFDAKKSTLTFRQKFSNEGSNVSRAREAVTKDFENQLMAQNFSSINFMRSERGKLATKFTNDYASMNISAPQSEMILERLEEDDFERGLGTLLDEVRAGVLSGKMTPFSSIRAPEKDLDKLFSDRFEKVNKALSTRDPDDLMALGNLGVGTPNDARELQRSLEALRSSTNGFKDFADDADAERRSKAIESAQGINFKTRTNLSKEQEEAMALELKTTLDNIGFRQLENKSKQRQLKIQYSQAILEGRIQSNMQKLADNIDNDNAFNATLLQRERNDSTIDISRDRFRKESSLFENVSSTELEDERQIRLQESIMEEQLKITKMENVERARQLMQKTLMEKRVIFALDSLGNTIDSIMGPLTRSIMGVLSVKTSTDGSSTQAIVSPDGGGVDISRPFGRYILTAEGKEREKNLKSQLKAKREEQEKAQAELVEAQNKLQLFDANPRRAARDFMAVRKPLVDGGIYKQLDLVRDGKTLGSEDRIMERLMENYSQINWREVEEILLEHGDTTHTNSRRSSILTMARQGKSRSEIRKWIDNNIANGDTQVKADRVAGFATKELVPESGDRAAILGADVVELLSSYASFPADADTEVVKKMNAARRPLINTLKRAYFDREGVAVGPVAEADRKVGEITRQTSRLSSDISILRTGVGAREGFSRRIDVKKAEDVVKRLITEKDLESLDFTNTESLAEQIEQIKVHSGTLENALDLVKSMKRKLGDSNKEEALKLTALGHRIELLALQEDGQSAMNEESIKQTRMQMYAARDGLFNGMQQSMKDLTKIMELDPVNAGSLSAIGRLVDQRRTDGTLEALMLDPTAKGSDIASARIQSRVRYGTDDQIDSLRSLSKERQRILSDETSFIEGTDTLTKDAENELKEVSKEIRNLVSTLERTTPRDGGFLSEFSTNFGDGLDLGFSQMREEAEGLYVRLGQQVPMAFRDGLTNAMTLAIQGADDLGDKLKQIGISFLQMIQQAFLQSAASRVTSSVGGLLGLASGGKVEGGSGVRDDVPALLMGGEYVMKKSAVQKYGPSFMDKVNQGMLPQFSQGGAVSMNIASPKVDEREAFVDKNQHGNITRYRVTKKGRGIDKRLSGFARANDRKIQEFFKDQENQFNEDLRTKEQEKQREENYQDYRTQQRKAYQGALLGIGLGALANYGMKKYQQSDFAKKRRSDRDLKRFDRSLEKNGKVRYKDGMGLSDMSTEAQNYYRGRSSWLQNNASPVNASRQLRNAGVNHTIVNRKGSGYDINLHYAEGGAVPAMVQGGEYVVNKGAASAIGPEMLSQINSGSYVGSPSSSNTSVSSNVNNDVNITINVSNEGVVTETSSDESPKELGNKIRSAVLDVLNEERRVGGSLR